MKSEDCDQDMPPFVIKVEPFLEEDFEENSQDFEEQDPFNIDSKSANPWQVNSLKVFLKYNCPQCSYKTKKEDDFLHHAIDKHEDAKTIWDPVESIGSFESKESTAKADLSTEAIDLNQNRFHLKKQTLSSPDFESLGCQDLLSEVETLQDLDPVELNCHGCSITDFGFHALRLNHVLKTHSFLKASNTDCLKKFQCHTCDESLTGRSEFLKHQGDCHPEFFKSVDSSFCKNQKRRIKVREKCLIFTLWTIFDDSA